MSDCERVRPWISDWVDGTLEGEPRAAVGAHVVTCASCRGLGADLRRVRDAARTLGPIEPPDHVFLEAAGRIRLEAPGPPARTVQPASRRATVQWLSIAAALVLATVGLWTISRPGAPAGEANAANAADVVSAELDLAVAHYEKAIAALESMAAANTLPVGAGVTATLRANLGVVDRAIAESRTALAASPNDATARESLFDALRQKVGLLQATVQLLDDVQGGSAEPPAAGRSGRSS